MLRYGAIVEGDFYDQLRAARQKHEPHLYTCSATQVREENFMDYMESHAPMVSVGKAMCVIQALCRTIQIM